jgi:hypothetical protein
MVSQKPSHHSRDPWFLFGSGGEKFKGLFKHGSDCFYSKKAMLN